MDNYTNSFSADQTPFKILVVDDNPDNIQVLGNMLREAGYIIGFATDGNQALKLLRKNNDYDLVLLDVDMPVMNGYDACRAMRIDETLKDLPVIFLTAFAEPENKVTGFEAGAQDYVTKPYHTQELLSRVRTHVELKRSREKLRNVNQWLEEQVKEKTGELAKAYTELNELDSMKTNFLVMISREIRSPLNGIVGTINLVKNEEHSTAVRNMVEIMEISLARLEKFADKAVLSTQLSSGKYPLKLEEIDLKAFIQFLLIELNDTMHVKNIKPEIKLEDPLPRLVADKDLLFNAFSYIIDNAIHFSPPNDSIEISVLSSGKKVLISVTDKGPGFSAKLLNTVFSPFSREKENAGHNIGLSLSIVKQIMGLIGGEIKIINVPGAGACIQLVFNQ